MITFQAIQRKRDLAAITPSAAGVTARRRGRAPVLVHGPQGAARAHEQALRRNARGLPTVDTTSTVLGLLPHYSHELSMPCCLKCSCGLRRSFFSCRILWVN